MQDANTGVYDGQHGDVLEVLDDSGATEEFFVTGTGRSLPGGEQVQDDGVIVLYATTETVAELSGDPGYGQLALRLVDPSPAAAEETVKAVRRELSSLPGFAGFSDLPTVRAPGDWPGKADTEEFAQLLSVITVLALLSALVLISNTISTLVAEQTREIGVMRALGARRRQVARVYLTTTLLLGAVGAVLGAGLGVALSSALSAYFGDSFWAVDVAPGVEPVVLLASLAAGVLTPLVAALPAIRRALRVDVREALEAGGSISGGSGRAGRLLRGLDRLPRVVQIGLRNVGRRRRRSLATASIVALAVGNLLAVLALAQAATDATESAWDDHLEDVEIWTTGAAAFDETAERLIRTTPGVAEAEPVLKNDARLGDLDAAVWGLEQEPLFGYSLAEGRWFSVDEEAAAAPVAVVERNIAELAGVEVGDQVTITTAGGDVELDVLGLADNQQDNGTAIYVPLPTVRAALGQPAGATSYFIRTESSDPDAIDRTTNQLEDRLAAVGHEISSEVTYLATQAEVEANSMLTTSIAVLGFVVVAMSMVGLANAVTTSVLERTREIGVLRSIGARARDIRRIFTTEGVALALLGWVIGIPLGYLLTRLLVRLVWEVVDVRLPIVFPPVNIAIALAGTVVLALLVLLLPVRRAVRFRPGEALRWA